MVLKIIFLAKTPKKGKLTKYDSYLEIMYKVPLFSCKVSELNLINLNSSKGNKN